MTPGKPIRILVAEDDKKTAALYERYLSKEVFTSEIVTNGRAAMDAYDREKPDILLLDLILPKPSGMEVLRHVREKRGDRTTTIVVATARHDETLKQSCERLDVQGYLVKPFDLKALNGTILKFHKYQGVHLDLDYDTPKPEKIRLLIAEDDKKQAAVYDRFLPSKVFSLKIEGNGLAALDVYREWKPDMIILDLTLPGLSGLGFLEEVREKAGDFYTTVIVATGERKVEAVKQCAGHDIQGYLVKPVDAKSLARMFLETRKKHQGELKRKGWLPE